MIDKILIANRGEIAVRIIRTCRKLGIQTVAIFSDADRNSLHVREADEAVYVGKAPSTESYLKIDEIIEAINKTGAKAVHPGYGFLSENQKFAKAVEKAGAVFIGPPIKAIKAMGDKIESKKLAKNAGVSCVPGYVGVIKDAKEAIKIAEEIGYPVMIKASAGGGGKGMRIARNKGEVEKGFNSSTSEAKSSFGDDRVFIEKYIENPRHIEIQVLADQHGNTIFLGERECSIQRRHQKVVEEAPSIFLDEKTRQKMGAESIALAKEVGYYSAGTVEFIVDSKKNFYFLEMNTRLQVEHRVTEQITGLDLVEEMIRIAAGDKLRYKQEDIKLKGWSIEARVYAEDTSRGFLPSIGRLNKYQEPEQSDKVFVDSGVYEGGSVSMYYDPMISKLITTGKDRNEAIKLMSQALGTYYISGVSTNIGFMENILNHKRFISGDISTNFIEEEYPEGFTSADLDDEITKRFIAVAVNVHVTDAIRASQMEGQLQGYERQIPTTWVVTIEGQQHLVNVVSNGEAFNVLLNNDIITVDSGWELGALMFQGKVNDSLVNMRVKYVNEGYKLTHKGARSVVYVQTPRTAELARYMPEISGEDDSDSLIAPMSGKILKVNVKAGDTVKSGQEIMVIEAMKMENSITAENQVKIDKVLVKEGDSVMADETLAEYAS